MIPFRGSPNPMFRNVASVSPAAITVARSVLALSSVPGIGYQWLRGACLSHLGFAGPGGGSDASGCRGGCPSKGGTARPPWAWLLAASGPMGPALATDRPVPPRRTSPYPASWRNCRRVGITSPQTGPVCPNRMTLASSFGNLDSHSAPHRIVRASRVTRIRGTIAWRMRGQLLGSNGTGKAMPSLPAKTNTRRHRPWAR